MTRYFCDRCNNEIEDFFAGKIRVIEDEDGPRFLVFGIEDEAGEEDDRDYCPACLIALIKDGIDLTLAHQAKEDEGLDESEPAEDPEPVEA